MNDYHQMNRAELIARLEALEAWPVDVAPLDKRTTAALRESEERLRAILETAVEGIITIDERGVIESINPAAESIFGYAAVEVIGQNVSLLMPSPYREGHDGYIASYVQTGQAKIIGIGREVIGQRKDGTVFPVELSVSEVKLADKRLFTGFARDITERKRLEKEVLAISDREQGRIGQDLHDGLCQQLAGIALMSEVLEQKLGDTSKAAATRAGEIARHIREAITQTRNLARGISPVDIDAGGLMSALEELAGNIRTLFKVDCVFRCDRPVLIRDNAVSMHLFRIAQEAVSNAIKHGKARHIGIGLTAMTERIVLAVQDDGTGFAKDTARRKGMGLRIMSYRAGMIGGSLAIQKDIDGGTTVVCSVHKSATKAPAPKEP